MNKLNISMVGYHNTLPFTYGLNTNKERYNLILDIPSRCMGYYDRREADVALVPVAELLGRDDFNVITDYCIGCVGEVETVCIYSNRPIRELSKIYLDSDSRSSQLLTKVLLKHHWYHTVDFEEIDVRTDPAIDSSSGILMIGDKTFGVESKYKYVYDLGREWQMMTGLPFAFALWIARPSLDAETVQQLNTDLSLGTENIDVVLSDNKELDKKIGLKDYYTKYIDFHFDEEKKMGFELYEELVSQL